MNESTLTAIVEELRETLQGKKFGRIFPLSKLTFAIDFRLNDDSYLFIGTEAAAPRIYLIKRGLRDLEKQSISQHSFVQLLRKHLSNAVVSAIEKDSGERIVRFQLQANDEIHGRKNYTFVIQLTGRSANLFLLDENDFIIDSLRDNEGEGQITATRFTPPQRAQTSTKPTDAVTFDQSGYATLSEALDAHHRKTDEEREFKNRARAAEAKIRSEITKREKLRRNLTNDLKQHGDAEKWKRYGDLILANLANAVRIDDTVLLVDYFSDEAPTIEIEVDRNLGLTEAAEKFFRKYTKARNAQTELQSRLEKLESELTDLNVSLNEINLALTEGDRSAFAPDEAEPQTNSGKKTKVSEPIKGVRRYHSSDGFEILVGKASKDNDHLTFRLSKSLDFWLHAADYGGSHVLVRNPNRLVELPQNTLYEAAQLAAYFSQAKEQPKVAVNYTQKKFVNKPRGAAPGLVSLSAFKTILVEPKESLERL